MAVFLYSEGDTVHRGIVGEYNQVDYDAPLSDFSIFKNDDGSVTVFHPIIGTDTLFHIDGIWSDADQSWYSIEDAIALTPNAPAHTSAPTDPAFEIDSYGVLRGTKNDDVLVDTADTNSLYGGLGDDTLIGTHGEYSQAEYDGYASDYTFTQNADGSLTVSHAVYGTDTLTDINGFWFQGEGAWYATEDLDINQGTGNVPVPGPGPLPIPVPTPEPTGDFEIDIYGVLRGTKNDDVLVDTDQTNSLHGGLGDDTLIGTAGEYSQAEYDGFSGDYTFTQNADGSLTVSHAVYGTDTLTNIDGFWFQGEGAWYATEDLNIGQSDTAPAPAPTPIPVPTPEPTPVDPTPNTPDTGTTIDGIITGSNDVDDFLNGDAGNNTFFSGRGTDVINGGAGNDTLNVDGDIFEWTFSTNADGSVTMTHPTWGENTLIGIENILSQRSGETFTIDEAIASTNGLPRFRLDNDNVINGTNGDDFIEASEDVQGFYGGTGDDVYFGTCLLYTSPSPRD